MASLGLAISAQLASSTAVAAITTNIIPNYAPKSAAYPQVVWEKKEAEPDVTYSGNSGLVKADVVIRCIAKSNYSNPSAGYAQADALANSVTAAMDGQGGTWGGVVVQRAFLQDDAEDQLEDQDSEEILYLIRELNFEIWFNNT
jgi:hypothetical protein